MMPMPQWLTFLANPDDISGKLAIIGDLKPSISEAIERPPLVALINSGANVKGIEQVLAVMINKAAQMLTVGGNLKPEHPLEIAKMLISEYATYSLDDFQIMLRRGVSGRYGEIYRFDVSVIFNWMAKYCEEWAEEKEKKIAELKKVDQIALPIQQMSSETQKMINDYLNELSGSKMQSVPRLTRNEIIAEGQSTPPEKKAAAVTYVSETMAQKKLDAAKKRGLHKLPLNELKEFVIEGEIIRARNEDEAREIYLEVF